LKKEKIVKTFPSTTLNKITVKIIIPKDQRLKELSSFIPEEKFKKFGFVNREGNYVSFAKEIGAQNVLKVKSKNRIF